MTNYYAVSNGQKLSLVSNQLPIVKLLFNESQAATMIGEIPRLLARFQEKLQRQITKYRSASSVQKQFKEVDEQLQSLTVLFQQQQKLHIERAMQLYAGFAQLFEFVMKQIPMENGQTLEEKTYEKYNNQRKDIPWFIAQLFELFNDEFNIKPTIQPINIEEDYLGINDEGTLYSYYVFTGYDVLYNYPTLFKTEDVPGFILNIATFLKPQLQKGQTKQAITAFAYKRILEGMGLKNKEYNAFTFHFNLLYKLTLSDYSVPLLTGRTRQRIFRVVGFEEMANNESIHYVEVDKKIQFTRQLVDYSPPGEFLSCSFNSQRFNELDFIHIPIEATWLATREQLAQEVDRIEHYKNYHQVLLQQFFNRIQEEENDESAHN